MAGELSSISNLPSSRRLARLSARGERASTVPAAHAFGPEHGVLARISMPKSRPSVALTLEHEPRVSTTFSTATRDALPDQRKACAPESASPAWAFPGPAKASNLASIIASGGGDVGGECIGGANASDPHAEQLSRALTRAASAMMSTPLMVTRWPGNVVLMTRSFVLPSTVMIAASCDANTALARVPAVKKITSHMWRAITITRGAERESRCNELSVGKNPVSR